MTSTDATNRRRKAGVKGQKKDKLNIDMTPMVDLGFLLISFFIITAELSRPGSAKLSMPKDGPSVLLRNSRALTVILAANDRVYYYQGNWEDARKTNEIFSADFSSGLLRKAIIQQKSQLD